VRLATRTTQSTGNCSIEWEAGGYVVRFPKDFAFVERFKNLLPKHARNWNPKGRYWIVDPSAIQLAASLIAQHFDQQIEIPAPDLQPQEVTGDIRLEYLGAAKERGGNPASSLGYANGNWSVEIPQTVLESWFNGQVSPDQSTLFAVLLVPEDADAVTIKSAYRRLARQWHPDVCREGNATEKFRQIQEAYEFLSDDQRRLRYLAGLSFEREGQPPANGWRGIVRFNTYAPPLRCGLLNVTGVMRLGRLVVSKINSWSDVTDDQGRVMVSSWQAGAETFSIQWREA
jgi:hypothetical protein